MSERGHLVSGILMSDTIAFIDLIVVSLILVVEIIDVIRHWRK